MSQRNEKFDDVDSDNDDIGGQIVSKHSTGTLFDEVDDDEKVDFTDDEDEDYEAYVPPNRRNNDNPAKNIADDDGKGTEHTDDSSASSDSLLDADDDKDDDDDDDKDGSGVNAKNRRSGLLKAERHYNNSMRLSQRKLYPQAIEEHKISLSLRESLLGRYHKDTANVYGELGDSYYLNQQYDNAIVAHNTWLRIERKSSNSFTKPAIDEWTRDSLKKKGLSDTEIDLYDSSINISLQHEHDGDMFRQRGEYKLAIKEYKESITVLSKWIGTEISVGYLWRKISFLVGRKNKTTITSNRKRENDKDDDTDSDDDGGNEDQTDEKSSNDIDWIEADRLDIEGKKENTYGLLEMVFQSIQQGDSLHGQCEYKEALETYQIACDIAQEELDSDREEGDGNSKNDDNLNDDVFNVSSHHGTMASSMHSTSRHSTGGMMVTAGVDTIKPILKDILGKMDDLNETLDDSVGQAKFDITEHMYKMLKETRMDMRTPLVAIVQSQNKTREGLQRMAQKQEEQYLKFRQQIQQENKDKFDTTKLSKKISTDIEDKMNLKIDRIQSILVKHVDKKIDNIQTSITEQMNDRMNQVMEQLVTINNSIDKNKQQQNKSNLKVEVLLFFSMVLILLGPIGYIFINEHQDLIMEEFARYYHNLTSVATSTMASL